MDPRQSRTEGLQADARAKELALHWLNVHRPERALEVLGGVSDQEDAYLWYLRAFAYRELKDDTSAERAVSQGLARDPAYVPLLDLSFVIFAARGDLAQAEARALAALSLNPQNANLLAGYARLVARAGQLDKAHALIERAAGFDPEDREVRAVRGLLAYVEGDDQALSREGRALLAQNPDDDLGHRLLMVQHFQEGRYDRAAQHSSHVARNDLKDAGAAEHAREARFWAHPLMLPVRPFVGFGVAKTWIAAVVGLTLLRLVSPRAAVAGSIAWISLCVYSWTVPHLLRWWLRRRSR